MQRVAVVSRKNCSLLELIRYVHQLLVGRFDTQVFVDSNYRDLYIIEGAVNTFMKHLPRLSFEPWPAGDSSVRCGSCLGKI